MKSEQRLLTDVTTVHCCKQSRGDSQMVVGVDGGGISNALVFQTIIETLVHLSVVPNITTTFLWQCWVHTDVHTVLTVLRDSGLRLNWVCRLNSINDNLTWKTKAKVNFNSKQRHLTGTFACLINRSCSLALLRSYRRSYCSHRAPRYSPIQFRYSILQIGQFAISFMSKSYRV